jgi:adenine-specific DNA-methyltransferase
MIRFLTDSTDIARIYYSSRLNPDHRSKFGQFLTPAMVARFMARQFNQFSGHIHLLDPGAGIGTLTAAVVERLLENPDPVKSLTITAYEIEPAFWDSLNQTLLQCCIALKNKGIAASYSLRKQDFIEFGHEFNLPFFQEKPIFTHIILNPPYRKIHGQSMEKKMLSAIGIDTANLYSAFVWIAILKLAENGEIVGITPRSFCNGTYFRAFRKTFLEIIKLEKIHIFESRSKTFSEDRVLQENIIFHGLKSKQIPHVVKITSSHENQLTTLLEVRSASYDQIIEPKDDEQFIHIFTNNLQNSLKVEMNRMPCTLKDIGLEVSTGPIVDFRVKSTLRSHLSETNIPLLYPEAIQGTKVVFPPKHPRKPIAIEKNQDTEKCLVSSGCYVLMKRFSSKEQKRRIAAAVCSPISGEFLGIENHLNYYHCQGKGIDFDLAKGLAGFLNSSLFDLYFRQFSGHTQVNATDLRKVRYPHPHDLVQIGIEIGDRDLNQKQMDEIIHRLLSIRTETVTAIQAIQKLEEARTILKAIGAPKEQQNERSALCLLALANIQPAQSWSEASAPMRRITEMMDWFRDHYGKQYAPNTRETVRRQTMHQFVQMGLVVENPDQADRPINSPKWCYRLDDQALLLLKTYGSQEWEQSVKSYHAQVNNLLRNKTRKISKLPITLPNGQVIELSSGGQNLLIRDVLESFCPRFTPGGILLYLGDAGDKFVIHETQKFEELGINLDPHGKMPDVVIYYQQQDWLVLLEAVTTHGPVNLKRHNELKKLFETSQKGLVFVTAFPSRKEMTRYLAEISWETEVWVADQPDHLIHFNGERFLGPY